MPLGPIRRQAAMKNPSENTVEIVMVMDMSHPIAWNNLSGGMCTNKRQVTRSRLEWRASVIDCALTLSVCQRGRTLHQRW